MQKRTKIKKSKPEKMLKIKREVYIVKNWGQSHSEMDTIHKGICVFCEPRLTSNNSCGSCDCLAIPSYVMSII